MRSIILNGLAVFVVLFWAARTQAAEVFTKDMLQPRGQYYEATVPDTLDLAERAKLSVHGLTSFLDATTNYAPWGHFAVDSSTPALLDRDGGWPNWGKIAEATAKMRYVCGSSEGIDNQLASLRGMIAKLPPSTVPNNGFVPHARVLIALSYLYQFSPTPALHDLIAAYADGFKKSVRNVGDCSYCGPESVPELGEKGGNVLGWPNPFVDGTSARALALWGTLDHDPSCIALAERLAKGLFDPKYWSPEAEPKAVVGSERGHFMGHMHSYVQGMLGMLYAADATHDARLMEFVRSGYEYQRNFGIARVGLFGEGCTTGDMTQLAIKLSEAGVGDYWDDVDYYIRNHLIEIQLMDPALLRQVTATMNGTFAKNYAATDRDYTDAIDRLIGTCTDDATHLTKTPQLSAVSTICGPGNVTAGIYLAWEAIVRCKNGRAQVNLLLNRASPWLDVESYLPYEGKVVIRNKTAQNLSARIPRWVDRSAVHVKLGGKILVPSWLNRFLLVGSITPGDVITITFPMVTTTEKYSLKWRQSEFWQECSLPHRSWSNDKPAVYTLTFKGNTLVDVAPRDGGEGIPLYQRNAMRDGTAAPMKQVRRFVPDAWLESDATSWTIHRETSNKKQTNKR
jgi:hypothetical protein